MSEVNVPNLRKVVEWAEAEAAKGEVLSAWYQMGWITDPAGRAYMMAAFYAAEHNDDANRMTFRDTYLQEMRDNQCGTAYCIAGYAAVEIAGEKFHCGTNEHGQTVPEVAAETLGIKLPDCKMRPEKGHLFHGSNTIQDVRRIAEELAGERL